LEEATIDLGNGKKWRMGTEVMGNDRSHVQSFTWNGKEPEPYRSIPHKELIAGGELRFTLGPRPGGSPGRFIPEFNDDWTPVPIIQAAGMSFTDSLLIIISSSDDRARIEYRIDEGEPRRYESPFWIQHSCTITATALVPGTQGRKNLIASKPATANFKKYEGGRTITMESTYANQYSAGGKNALIDGVRGGKDFRTGEWQGYEGQDVVLMIDLGRVQRLKRVGLSLLQDQKSWIWLPSEVTFSVSTNQRQWSSATVTHDVDRQQDGAITRELWRELGGRKARYIAVTAKNAGPCPDWHPGKGGKTWVFADEVLIETEP
ncbi:MAG TPA: hypothetical protein PKY96_02245, partial [Flavobacteriales bacterium]|nr:hypothetical protein [Flavobacteriales bacterium]